MKKNIYAEARRAAKRTQTEAADGLYIGLSSLKAYEEGRVKVSDTMAARMAEYYKCPWLNYLWLQETQAPGQICLPKIKPMDLCQCVIYMQKELGDVQRHLGKLIDIAADGVAAADEKEQFDEICREAMEAAGALLTLALCGRTMGGGPNAA